MAVLRARALSKRFSGVAVVRDVDFTVEPGEIVGYLGPNGSGKTTTIRMLAGLIEPSSGRVEFDDRDVGDDLIAFRRRLGYIPEEPFLYPFLSGREYLELIGRLRELPDALMQDKITRFLDLFGILGAADQSIASYSKGMRQKVLISAALLHDPEIVILDEPNSGLDVTTTLVLRSLVQALASEGRMIIYSSHLLEAVERAASDVLILHEGRVVAHDSVDRLRGLMELPSLEQVFRRLVIETDIDGVARDLVSTMRR